MAGIYIPLGAVIGSSSIRLNQVGSLWRVNRVPIWKAAIREAIAFHLDGMREDGAPVPPPSSGVEYVEVVV
jgi:hypothetical protein